MNLHNVIANVLLEHLEKFEMDLVNMEHSKVSLMCVTCVSLFNESLKVFKKISMIYLWEFS
jgi:hypothetical protein